jgi:hypothetical protein
VLERGWEHARNLMKQSALKRKSTRWLLTAPLRWQMNELHGCGLGMEGWVICN